MLALLPQILFLGAFAATLIRITIALVLAYNAWHRVSQQDMSARALAAVEIGIAVALFVGAWTQIAAIAGVIVFALALFLPRFRLLPRSSIALALIMTITLIVTGPGAFAFDLPL
jgi:hypothetical protein